MLLSNEYDRFNLKKAPEILNVKKAFNDLVISKMATGKRNCVKKYIFKEICGEYELVEMFALRYLVYNYVHFIEPNPYQLDVDCFDPYSTFLGAYEVTNSVSRLIGTVRIIHGDKQSDSAEEIERIVSRLYGSEAMDILNRRVFFPIMQNFRLPEAYLSPFRNGGAESIDKPYEISRLAVLPEFWDIKAEIETGLHELIILNSWKPEPKRNIYLIATHPRTRRRYRKIGFRIIPGTKERVYKPLKQLAIAMSLDLDKYLLSPNPYKDRCESVFKAFLRDGYFIKYLLDDVTAP